MYYQKILIIPNIGLVCILHITIKMLLVKNETDFEKSNLEERKDLLDQITHIM